MLKIPVMVALATMVLPISMALPGASAPLDDTTLTDSPATVEVIQVPLVRHTFGPFQSITVNQSCPSDHPNLRREYPITVGGVWPEGMWNALSTGTTTVWGWLTWFNLGDVTLHLDMNCTT